MQIALCSSCHWIQELSVNKAPINCRCSRHRRRYQVSATPLTLTPFEVSVRGRCAALARLKPIGIHRETHRTPRLAPFEARIQEYSVKSLRLGLCLDQPRSGHHHRKLNAIGHLFALGHRRRCP